MAILLFLFNIWLIIIAVHCWPKFDRSIVFLEAEEYLKNGRDRQVFYKILGDVPLDIRRQ